MKSPLVEYIRMGIGIYLGMMLIDSVLKLAMLIFAAIGQALLRGTLV